MVWVVWGVGGAWEACVRAVSIDESSVVNNCTACSISAVVGGLCVAVRGLRGVSFWRMSARAERRAWVEVDGTGDVAGRDDGVGGYASGAGGGMIGSGRTRGNVGRKRIDAYGEVSLGWGCGTVAYEEVAIVGWVEWMGVARIDRVIGCVYG